LRGERDHRHRHVHGLRRRARGRARGLGAEMHGRADVGAASLPQRRRAGTRGQGRHHGPEPDLCARRDGDARRDLRRDRRDQRFHRARREARAELHRDGDDPDAVKDRLGAPHDLPQPDPLSGRPGGSAPPPPGGHSGTGEGAAHSALFDPGYYDGAMNAFLGVEASATGRRWLGPTAEADRRAEAIGQATALPLPLARVLAARGVAPEEAARFLDPQLRDLLPDPRSLKDMGLAATRFVKALKGRERIAIFADYDVDGGASAALLVWWLRHFGREATLYIPDRIDEGYGPNEPAMAALAARHDLIVCVDCGTLSHGPVAAARGADVVILDHHLGAETLPPALAVVNPNRQDESGDLGHLCAASVVFLMLVEANRLLREEALAGPDLMALLDLVALATVADVAPLRGVNRALVRQGLKVMARRE